MKKIKELVEDLVFQGFGILSYTHSAGVQYLNDVSVKELIDTKEIEEFDFYEEENKDEIIENINRLFHLYGRGVDIYGGLRRDYYLASRQLENDEQFLLLPTLN